MANEQLQSTIETLYERRRKRERMTRIGWIVAGVCALILLVCLMVPAFTMEHNKYDCGLEEHTHTAQCYTNEVVCGLPTEKAHVHTPSCYSKSGKLTCEKAEAGHIHLDPCYDKNGKLVCDKEETVHIHKASCFDSNGNNVCKNKDALHVHGDTCYKVVKSDTDKSSKESADEKDSKSTKEPVAYQLTCNEESVGHVHRDACYDDNGKLVCGKDEKIEIPHKHDESCYEKVLACGQEEHTHTDECLKEEVPATPAVDEEGNLIDGDAADNAEGDTVADENVDLVDESAEPDLTDKEIKEAEDQGLLYENDKMLVVFNVPDEIKDNIKLNVTEISDAEVDSISAENDANMIAAIAERMDESANGTGEANNSGKDGAGVVSLTADESGNDTTAVPNDAAIDQSATPENASAEDAAAANEDKEPVYKTNLKIEALLNGEPVEQIGDLGITANVQMKSSVIKPILKEFDYKKMDADVKDQFGAEITIKQMGIVTPNTSLSEMPEDSIDTVIVNNASYSTASVNLMSQYATVAVEETANPNFTVQFYANIPTIKLDTTGNSKLPVIDTSGGKMPKNGVAPAVKYLTLDANKKVKTENKLTPVYSSERYKYSNRPEMNDFNKVRSNKDYDPIAIWVLKPGRNSSSTIADDFDVYDKNRCYDKENKQWLFSNNPKAQNAIYIDDNSTIRIVFDITREEKDESGVDFYDYDISDGYIYSTRSGYTLTGKANTSTQSTNTSTNVFTYTGKKGINSGTKATSLGFGNANTGSGIYDNTWNNNFINKYNGTSGGNGYQGCCFNLVSGLNAKKNGVVYSSGITGNDIFSQSNGTGKTYLTGGKLTFNRIGDTYTLSSAAIRGANAKNQSYTTANLDAFSNPSYIKNGETIKTHTGIFTNNFWPMDNSVTYGANGHDLKFGDLNYFTLSNSSTKYSEANDRRRFVGRNGNDTDYKTTGFPVSDDSLDHNAYFGMNFNIDFKIDSDYVGPLEYLFFGDDDLWIFLDDQLIIDIGGVHSSVGEYANLWDTLNKLPESKRYGKHTLRVFYTERGSSGSTCYMNFTLPSVTFQTPDTPSDQEVSSLKVSKTVQASTDVSDEEFKFSLKMNLAAGNQQDVFDYSIYEKNESNNTFVSSGTLSTNDIFFLKNNQYIEIVNLPIGTTYELKEILTNDRDAAYITTSTVSSKPNEEFARDVEGVISNEVTKVDYINYKQYQLPDTGGMGVYWFWISGSVLICIGVGTIIWRRRRNAVSAR